MREVLTPAAWACSSIVLAEGDLIQVFTNAQMNFYVSYVTQMSDAPVLVMFNLPDPQHKVNVISDSTDVQRAQN